MIKSLRLKHFKSWADTEELTFAPITAFFGANSSGKSSIVQFLLLLKQTSESNDQSTILKFRGGTTDYVDLGTFLDFIYNHDLRLPLEFDLAWTSAEVTSENYRPREFSAVIRQHEKQIVVEHYE
jgi:AAA15 family ATPase/GTPase